jgi:hypothetical protein
MWAILLTVLGGNAAKQYSLHKINSRIIKYYQVKSALPLAAKSVSDSLSREITKDLKLKEKFVVHNPLQQKVAGGLELRFYLILISILTIGFYYYFRRRL